MKINKGDTFRLTKNGVTLNFVDYVDDGSGMVFVAKNKDTDTVHNFDTESVMSYIDKGNMIKVEGEL